MGNNLSLPTNIKLKLISDKNKAIELLNDAEKEDFYLEECYDNKANSISRRKFTYAPNIIPANEIKYATDFLNTCHSILPQKLLMDLDEVKIINLMPSADGGMPHTRPGNIICVPNLIQLYSKSTLIHELWHIHQRKFQDVWYKVFKRLGWTLWNGYLPTHLEQNRRINPDTLDYPLWIFDNEWVPVPIFKNITNPNVNDVEIWFYNPDKNMHIKRVPPSLESYFPDLPASAYEHPREITAYVLSEPERYNNSLGFKHLIEQLGNISIVQST